MIDVKNSQEIKTMQQGGKILAEVLGEVLSYAKPGVSEIELDSLTDQLIVKKGAYPGFKKVKGYHHAICVSTNDVVVHGIPTQYKLKEGDVVGIDCGVYFAGFYTDMAETLCVSTISNQQSTINKNKIDKFLKTGKRALEEAIKRAKVGNRVGHISKIIQDIVETKGGYSVVRSLVGHGVGKKLHEEPQVPGHLEESMQKTPLLQEGMTIAIEVIYNMGSSDVEYANSDGWTISTKDGSVSAVFERTVAVTKNGPIVLTE